MPPMKVASIGINLREENAAYISPSLTEEVGEDDRPSKKRACATELILPGVPAVCPQVLKAEMKKAQEKVKKK